MHFNEESRENPKWFGKKKSVFLSFITFLGDATSISADFFSCSLKNEIKLHVIDSTKFRLTLRCECFK